VAGGAGRAEARSGCSSEQRRSAEAVRGELCRAAPIVPGGCPLLNTAIDADDGNAVLRERARKALREWRDLLSSIISAGVERKEIRRGVDARTLATLIISFLEGALMISRLERHHQALLAAQSHLERYLETEVRLSG
jgi:TetR/AcrR family transcriptional regulator, transcriptional repressor for nem operon